MNSTVFIPEGNDKITVELTVKEAIALTGIRFNGDPQLVMEARKKLQSTIEGKFNEDHAAVH